MMDMMTTMLRLVPRVVLSMAVLSIFLFSFCSRKGEETKQQDVPTITFWHFRSEPSQRAALDKLIARFEQENNCKVHSVPLSWGNGKTKLFAAFNSNTAPDVLHLGADWIAQFSAGGVLRNLSNDGIKLDRFVPFVAPPALFKGSVYALPWIVDTRVMFYNKDLLKNVGVTKTPMTFTDVMNACEKIREASSDGVYGFGVNGADEHRLYKKILSFFWSSGGDVFDASGKPIINSAENIKALEAYIALARCGFVETQRQLDNMFIQGKLGFVVTGSWLLDQIKRDNAKLNYGTALVPGLAGKQSVSFAGADYVAVNAKSSNAELAKKFALFMTNGKNTLEFCKAFSEAGFPADKKFVNDEYFATVPHRDTFSQQLLSSKMPPVHPQWLDIEHIIEEATVEALLGKKTAQQALDDAQWQLTGIVSKRPT